MASFVVNLGLAPDDYYRLTGYEREALIAEFNRVNKTTR
jgi:hypothetical protein